MKNSINIPLAIPHVHDVHEILLNIKNDYKWLRTGSSKKKEEEKLASPATYN